MFGLSDLINDWIRTMMIDGITANFTGMFNELNTKVGEISTQVGQTPQGWNAGIFNMVRTLSETVIIPIAGVILTFILCYELIQMIIEKNNLVEFDLFNIYKWIFKTFCAVYILTNTFDIVMGVFELAQNVVNSSAGVINGSLDINLALAELADQLEALTTGELIALYMESMILSLAMKIMSLCIFIIIFGRMVEIYLVISVAPVPFSTMISREWGSIGNNYLKSLFALAFQGFLIMACVAIYAILLQGITASGDIRASVWLCGGYSLLLCMMLLKSGSISKSAFQAH